MAEAVATVRTETSTVEAARRLRKVDVPALVVCNGTGTIRGIVTESDIVAVVAERGGNRPVEAFMSSPVLTTNPSTPVGRAGDRMSDAGVTVLPVVEDDATTVGMITREDLAPHLSRHRLDIDWTGDPLCLDGRDTPVRPVR